MELIELKQYCESKIEERLLLAIAAEFADVESAGMKLAGMAPGEYDGTNVYDAERSFAYLMPQAVVEGADETQDWKYRVDFLLILGSRPVHRQCFAIECDGHEWHEKTKQQVARDKLRDRRMILDGIVPIRFSGSEIHRAPAACSGYIRSLAHASLGDVLYAEDQFEKLAMARRGKTPEGGF